jgi:putative phosphoesterase
MRFLVLSDVHGNLPALENVLKNEPNVDGYINLGDVVNYGPWSNECVELISSLDNCYSILGNHEEYFTKGVCDVKSELVQSFFKQTFEGFKHKSIIEKYKKSTDLNGVKLRHTLGVKDYIFRDIEVNLSESTFIGHSHQQYIRFINGNLLVNPGSVGQNRNFINLSEYVTWDVATGEIETKSVTYKLDYLITEMRERNYPQMCIDYYKNKKILHAG